MVGRADNGNALQSRKAGGMMKPKLVILSVMFTIISLAQILGAQTLSMRFLSDTGTENVNFRQADTFGFSVSYMPNIYGVYSNHVAFRLKWDSSNPTFMDDLFFPPSGQGSCGSPNASVGPPQSWDRRCIDSVGYIWKYVACPQGSSACQTNDLWNAYPGTTNLSTFASPDNPPIWPRVNAWGVLNFNYSINKDAINSVITSPPLTGDDQTCHPNNPSAFATGAANAKAVQVFYYNGSSRWYMAFNEQIHDSSVADTQKQVYTNDNWRILWATSSDGMNWTVTPQILFRSTSEATACFTGLLVTDMFLDNGYFYMTFTEVGTDRVYLARSPINADPNAQIGYTSWSIATPPSPSDPNHFYGWTPLTLGVQQNFAALNAASIFPTQNNCPHCGFGFGVKQAAIARVFSSTQPNASSVYVGATSDVQYGCNPSSGPCPSVLEVWSAPAVTQQFSYSSVVDTSSLSNGGNGWEFGFTHYSDNLPSSPRIVASSFDFWVIQSLSNPDRSLLDNTPHTTLTRKTAQLVQ
jgi:hypothetical protein